MIGGGPGDPGDPVGVVAVVYGHVGGGGGVPVDGVKESRIVGVEDGVGAAFVVDVEGSEGFRMFEHFGFERLV